MVDYLPRSAWGAREPKAGPGPLTVSRVEGAVIHWPGSSDPDGIHTQAEVASALRGWQNYHMDDRGWSDIAYQVAVDQAGRAWTLRGLRTQSGANGNNDVNERYGAILLVLVTGEQPTAAMKATVREVIADFRRIYPKGTAIRPHSAVRPEPTDCPGDAARAAIARGDFTPGATPPPVQEDDMANADEVLAEVKAVRAEATARYKADTDRWEVEVAALRTEAQRWQNLFNLLAADADTDALAAAIVAKLPAGEAIDQATVEAGVRAVLRAGTG